MQDKETSDITHLAVRGRFHAVLKHCLIDIQCIQLISVVKHERRNDMTLCCCKIPCNIPCKVDPLYINLFSRLVKNHSIIFSLQTKDLLILKILLQLFQFSDINNFYKSMLLCMLVLNISWVFFFREKNKGYSKFKWSHAIHH